MSEKEQQVNTSIENTIYLPHVIGLVGKAGSGKDRFYWTELAKFGYVRYAFADPLKVLASIYLLRSFPNALESENLLRLFPSIYNEVFSDQKTDFIRNLLQYLGTDVARNYDLSYWINIARNVLKSKVSRGIRVCITDVRFKNEADFLRKEFDAVLVRIEGSGVYSSNNLLGLHESETELEDIECDYNEEGFKKRFFR